MEAEILTARLFWSGDRVLSFSSETRTTAAAPSPVGQHMSSVLGYEIISAFMTSSRLNCF